MKNILRALAILAVSAVATTAFAASMSVVSDTSVEITGVYNKAGGGNDFVDLSGSPLNAVRAQEPKPYPTGYVSEGAEVTNSVWDNGVVGYDFEVSAPSADWIWETERAEGPLSYDPADDLYDADASRYGRVVVFEKTFNIDGIPNSGILRIAADNGWEVYVNGNPVGRSGTTVAGWETSNLHEAFLDTSGWQTVGNLDVSAELVNGENTLEIWAGNEYYFTDDGNNPSPAFVANPYRQQNPGAAIFNLAIEYTPVESLVVEKTVDTSFDRDWDWIIEKSANETDLELADGEIYGVDYEVELTPSSEDINHQVTGTITITNPEGNPDATIDELADIVDELDSGAPMTVDCGDAEFPVVLAGGDSLDCTYSGAADGTEDENTVTVTTSGDVPGNSDTEDVIWGDPVNETDECVTVNDDNPNGPQGEEICQDDPDADKTIPYSVKFGTEDATDEDVVLICGENEYTNTADFVTNDNEEIDDDDWTLAVTVDCEFGCTLTQGYWKTHSLEGKAPYDNNWANLGDFDSDFDEEQEDEDLPSSNLDDPTWYEAFWTAPKKGNVWYQLAHQWMAAYLNDLNGAATPDEVDGALVGGLTWLAGHDPATNTKGKDATDAAGWASLLGSYNEGSIGPGHCDEQIPI